LLGLAAWFFLCEPAWAQEPTPAPTGAAAEYDRSAWPLWTDEDRDREDARTEVLIRDSLIPPRVFVNNRGNRLVSEGVWVCPYTGQVMTDPRQLDIDHMVPLGYAFHAGGKDWTREQRQAYANWLQDPNHLKAVSASANRSKSDQGPAEWKPPLKTTWCEYAIAFAEVATTWHLTLPPADAHAIVEMIATCPLSNRWDLRE